MSRDPNPARLDGVARVARFARGPDTGVVAGVAGDASVDRSTTGAPRRGSRRSLARLVHVIVPAVVPVPMAGVSAIATSEVNDPRPALRELAKPLKEAGLKVRVHVVAGYAVPEILRVARDAGSDLIAMATSGKRGLARLFLGSVAEELLRESDRPVLLSHEPEGAP